MLEFPLARDLFDGAYCLRAFFLALYTTTLGCMAYCVLCDPGTLKREEHRKAFARLEQTNGGTTAQPGEDSFEDLPLPRRCHKTWLWALPIRRYDHYCRWLTASIGLLNHREFIVMVT